MSRITPVPIDLSLVASGTAPLVMSSPTLVTNLNADMLDGSHASDFATAAHTHTLDDLSDVAVAGAASGQVVKYNGIVWTTGTATAGVSITSINADSNAAQTLVVGTAGTDFNIADATGAHAFNIPTASINNRGLLGTGDFKTFNSDRISTSLLDGQIIVGNASNVAASRTMNGDATISNIGTITLATVPVTKGGTGGNSANSGLNNLLPAQSAGGGVGTSGDFLSSDGTNASWVRHAGSGNTLFYATAQQFNLPSTGFAQFDINVGGSTQAEYVPVVAYDAGAQEYADKMIYLDEKYRGGGFALILGHTQNGVAGNTGSVTVGAAFQAITTTTNLKTAKTYDFNVSTFTVATSGGMIKEDTITFATGADMDSCVVNRPAWLRITRAATSGTDTWTTDWHLVYFRLMENT